MEVTRLSSEGQIFIPQALRAAHPWEAGQELVAIDVGEGILLKLKSLFQRQHWLKLQDVCAIGKHQKVLMN